MAYASRQNDNAEKKCPFSTGSRSISLWRVDLILNGKQSYCPSHLSFSSEEPDKGVIGTLVSQVTQIFRNIELQFKPVITNGAANALSQSPVEVPNLCLVNVTDKPDKVLTRVQNEQRKDEELKRFIR